VLRARVPELSRLGQVRSGLYSTVSTASNFKSLNFASAKYSSRSVKYQLSNFNDLMIAFFSAGTENIPTYEEFLNSQSSSVGTFLHSAVKVWDTSDNIFTKIVYLIHSKHWIKLHGIKLLFNVE